MFSRWSKIPNFFAITRQILSIWEHAARGRRATIEPWQRPTSSVGPRRPCLRRQTRARVATPSAGDPHPRPAHDPQLRGVLLHAETEGSDEHPIDVAHVGYVLVGVRRGARVVHDCAVNDSR